MEEILKNALAQAPGLVVLVVLVIVFLKAMAKRDDFIKGLTDEHIAERRLQREVITLNTLAAGTNTAALNNVAHVINKTSER